MAASSHRRLARKSYMLMLKAARQLEQVALKRQQPLTQELARFYLPLGMPEGATLTDAVRSHFKAFRNYKGEDAQKALDQAFDATRLARERIDRLQSVSFMGRANDAAFNIGQICRHKKYDYKFVIFGWHKACKMPEEWVKAMGVDHLPRGRSQPFYHCLADLNERPMESSITYVAEDNVEPVEASMPVLHPMVEQVFSHFIPGAGYLPTARLRAEYPEDVLPTRTEDDYIGRYRREAGARRRREGQEAKEAAGRRKAEDRVLKQAERVRAESRAGRWAGAGAGAGEGEGAGPRTASEPVGGQLDPATAATPAAASRDGTLSAAAGELEGELKGGAGRSAAPSARQEPAAEQPPRLDSKTAGSVMASGGMGSGGAVPASATGSDAVSEAEAGAGASSRSGSKDRTNS